MSEKKSRFIAIDVQTVTLHFIVYAWNDYFYLISSCFILSLSTMINVRVNERLATAKPKSNILRHRPLTVLLERIT